MPAPISPETRSAMTLPIPLVPLPASGAGQAPPPGPVLILTRPPGLALATLPGHGRQATRQPRRAIPVQDHDTHARVHA